MSRINIKIIINEKKNAWKKSFEFVIDLLNKYTALSETGIENAEICLRAQ